MSPLAAAAAPRRLLLIGAGRRARAHLAALQLLGQRFRTVAVYDLDATAAAASAALLGCRAYSDLQTCLAAEAVEVADLVTPEPSHHALAIRLLEHGVHVICETPIALSIPLADLMIEAARSAQRQLIIAENVLHEPWFQIWRSIVESGVLGQVLRVACLELQASYHGACMVRTLAGSPPRRVRALARNDQLDPSLDGNGDPQQRERWLCGLLEHVDGVTSLLEHSSLAQAGLLGRRSWRLQVAGSRGTLHNDRLHLLGAPDPGLLIEAHRPEETLHELRLRLDPPLVWTPRLSQSSAEVSLVETLLAAADQLDGAAPAYPLELARLDLATALLLEESAARAGMPLSLPFDHPTGVERQAEQQLAREHQVDLLDLEAVRTTLFKRR